MACVVLFAARTQGLVEQRIRARPCRVGETRHCLAATRTAPQEQRAFKLPTPQTSGVQYLGDLGVERLSIREAPGLHTAPSTLAAPASTGPTAPSSRLPSVSAGGWTTVTRGGRSGSRLEASFLPRGLLHTLLLHYKPLFALFALFAIRPAPVCRRRALLLTPACPAGVCSVILVPAAHLCSRRQPMPWPICHTCNPNSAPHPPPRHSSSQTPALAPSAPATRDPHRASRQPSRSPQTILNPSASEPPFGPTSSAPHPLHPTSPPRRRTHTAPFRPDASLTYPLTHSLTNSPRQYKLPRQPPSPPPPSPRTRMLPAQ